MVFFCRRRRAPLKVFRTRSVVVVAGVLGAVLLLAFLAPGILTVPLSVVGDLWNLLLVGVAVVALLGFVYSFYLRRVLRARRISVLRMRRLMREASQRGQQ